RRGVADVRVREAGRNVEHRRAARARRGRGRDGRVRTEAALRRSVAPVQGLSAGERRTVSRRRSSRGARPRDRSAGLRRAVRARRDLLQRRPHFPRRMRVARQPGAAGSGAGRRAPGSHQHHADRSHRLLAEAGRAGESVTGRRAVATALAAFGAGCGGWLTAGVRAARAADAPAPVPALTDSAAAEVAPPADETIALEEPATGATPQVAPLVVTGYVDVGFAKAQGNGTSFHPADNRSPLDYGVDPFAPAVNSRGEAASTDPGTDPNGYPRFVNGFLPRSAGIGGTPSFLLN